MRFQIALILAVGVILVSCGRSRARGTRVVLITLDTLRFDSFEKLPTSDDGSRTSDMPHLAAWAEDSAVFANFYAATSQTQPSHASMFTGLHPWQHGISRNGLNLITENKTVVEVLKAAGYQTSAVVASFPLSRKFGFERGFDVLDDEFERGKRGFWLNEEEKKTDGEKPFFSRADFVSEKALALIDQAADNDRQFFWFHYFDPHDPYGVSTDGGPLAGPMEAIGLAEKGKDPSEAIHRARKLHDQDVAFLDQWLAKVLDRLNGDDGFTNHVIIVADHGESFGEDGSMAHGTRVTAGQIHVPCLIRSPKIKPGRKKDAAGSIDVAATILSLAGFEPLPEVGGRDLTESPTRPATAFGMRPVYGSGAMFPRLDGKQHPLDGLLFYAVVSGQITKGNSEEVYDLPEHLSEDERSRLSKQLKQLFRTFEAELNGAVQEENLDPEVRKTLQALGYIA